MSWHFFLQCRYFFFVNWSKAPDKKPPGQKLPGQKPQSISPQGLLKRLLRNMPLTLTCSDYGQPILKQNPAPGFFWGGFLPGVSTAYFAIVKWGAFCYRVFFTRRVEGILSWEAFCNGRHLSWGFIIRGYFAGGLFFGGHLF